MVEQDTPLYAAKFVFPAVPAQQQIERVKQALMPLDPQAKVIPPDPPAKYTMDFLKRMAFPLVLSAFALVSIAALIGFSFYINRRKYNIYKLCGATKGALCMLCVMDVFVFTVLGYLLGSGASTAFMAASDWASYELSAVNYALLYLLVLALTLLFAALPIQRVTRHFERIEI
ncbi:MAG: FtsX-like permease family protein [Oscillospiraceae bacterium]